MWLSFDLEKGHACAGEKLFPCIPHTLVKKEYIRECVSEGLGPCPALAVGAH